jgi:hypothetical protein
MTRKDYRTLAAVLADTRPDAEDYTQHSAIGDNTMYNRIAHKAAEDAWRRTAVELANALSDDSGYDLNGNRRFARDRFYAAAGMREAAER